MIQVRTREMVVTATRQRALRPGWMPRSAVNGAVQAKPEARRGTQGSPWGVALDRRRPLAYRLILVCFVYFVGEQIFSEAHTHTSALLMQHLSEFVAGVSFCRASVVRRASAGLGKGSKASKQSKDKKARRRRATGSAAISDSSEGEAQEEEDDDNDEDWA